MFKREEKLNAPFRKKTLFSLFFSLLFFFLVSCGQPVVVYEVGDELTNENENTLNLNANTPNKFQFELVQIAGPKGLKASVPFRQFVDVLETVEFDYTKEGLYAVSITTITKSDGLIVHEQIVEWEYSRKIPPAPVVSISDGVYTNKDMISFLLSEEDMGEDHDINELWIEGDIDPDPDGAWFPLSEDMTFKGLLSYKPLVNGEKFIKLKYRNIFGTESELTTISLFKKRNRPTDCILLFSDIQPGGYINASEIDFTLKVSDYLEGSDEVPENFYRIRGSDESLTEWVSFKEETMGTISIDSPEEDKRYAYDVEVKDIAGNTCEIDTVNLVYDSDKSLIAHMEPYDLDHPLWTSNREVSLKIYHPLSQTKDLEVYLYGDFTGPTTLEWISYDEVEDSIWDLSLQSWSANKWIRVYFREAGEGGKEVGFQERSIYLDPQLSVEVVNSFIQVKPPTFNPDDIASISISGCQEDYESIEYTYNKSYDCTRKEGVEKATLLIEFDHPEVEESNRTLTLEKAFP